MSQKIFSNKFYLIKLLKFSNIKEMNCNSLLIFFFTFAIWSNVGVDPNLLISFFFDSDIISKIRAIIPIILIIFLLLIIKKSRKNYKFDRYLIIFFTLYLLSQFIAGWTYNSYNIFLYKSYIALQSLQLMIFILVIYDNPHFIKVSLVTSLIILILLSIYFTFQNVIEVVNYGRSFYSNNYNNNFVLFNTAVPRSTGLSRMLAILAIAKLFYLYTKKDQKKKIIVSILLISNLIFLINYHT